MKKTILFLLISVSVFSQNQSRLTSLGTANATLTGTPTAPTATAGTNTTQIATTAFVQENVGANTYWTKTGNDIANNNSGIVTAAGMRFGNLGSNVFAEFNRYGSDISFILGNPGTQTTNIKLNNAFAGELSASADLYLSAGGSYQNSASNLKLKLTSSRIEASVPVKLKSYTVATLPTGNAGDMAYCTDLLTPVYMATAVGGGTIVWKVFHDGTGWKVD